MSSYYTPAPAPRSNLARYRVLSPLSGLRVSPLTLGAMSIGDKWVELGMGDMNKEKSFKLLDSYYDLGGNFIDTSNNYQDGSSEAVIGEWMELRKNRNEMVVATKYSSNWYRRDGANPNTIQANFTGNSVKSLLVSFEASLKKLRTHYVDILYVHWPDYETSIEEIMNSLHILVTQGKVLYLGVSDAPAWFVSYANCYAKMSNKTPFCIYQGHWNVFDRSIEREILPMCRNLGLAVCPWGVLAGGKLRTDAEEAAREASGEAWRTMFGDWKRTPQEKEMCAVLERIAGEHGPEVDVRSVAVAYVMLKAPYVFPVLGGRKPEQLQQNLLALELDLTKAQMDAIDSVVPFDPGFPTLMIGDGSSYNADINASIQMSRMPRIEAIRPAK